ncbi:MULTISPECIES: sulfatase [unclassified Oceanispirochaeta]|uniref:sulfatase family protein n=1 Tax=unclassified Oceanispirochaeta TaxID=2635722 RepID=UPI000E08D84F|nr:MULTISPECIES: sulfatase-like hydrolase/transferase [unclassified Oceanispirochaeta]MBF9016629.1 sulfatase-like hydrolase/transferase [Oceanispirochaeta sp. M2]NPD73166.1 sulfatase-like hydrolase/transferase [Oceanispirochaeta sp. M1]RDG31262.1 arylsulfatase [Oceanispirochaeta sp. M1]
MDGSQETDTLTTLPYDRTDSETEKPNILILMTDQQRHDSISAGGADFMHTPQLDRLAASGRLYSNAFTPIPDGMPARHNLLTGLTGKTHGYTENNRTFGMPGWIYTYPQLLSDHGYETISIGKNQFVPPRRHRGYDRIHLMEPHPEFREEDDYAVYLKKQGYGHILNLHGCENLLYHIPQNSLLPEEHQGDSWIADRALDFLETNRGRHPWMMKLSWLSPHPPQTPARRFTDLYSEKELPATLKSTTPLSHAADRNAGMFRNIPSAWFRRYRELYYSSISQVDYNIGRVLDCLEDTDQRRNTLIIFLSDHGDMLGDHDCMEKGLPYDSCTRIPLILSYPEKIDPGEKNSDFADLNDIFPTIMDATGIKISYTTSRLPGESLIKDKKSMKKDRSIQYVEYGSGSRRWISLRTNNYKFNYYYREGREELFNLKDDPAESRNLLFGSQDETVKKVRENLRSRLLEQERLWGPDGCLNEDNFISLEESAELPALTGRYPVFQNKIKDPREQNRMNGFVDEVLQCVEKESIVELEQLDLEKWQKEGGLSDKQIRDLLVKEKTLKPTPKKTPE